MNKQRIKQITSITILLGVVFVGIGGLFSPPILRVRHDWAPNILSQIAYRIEILGNFFMVIAPVVLVVADWRNIFPSRKDKNKCQNEIGK